MSPPLTTAWLPRGPTVGGERKRRWAEIPPREFPQSPAVLRGDPRDFRDEVYCGLDTGGGERKRRWAEIPTRVPPVSVSSRGSGGQIVVKSSSIRNRRLWPRQGVHRPRHEQAHSLPGAREPDGHRPLHEHQHAPRQGAVPQGRPRGARTHVHVFPQR